MLSASELHLRGVGASAAGKYGVARALFNKAGTRSPDDDLRARISMSLAYVESETGNLRTGLALCEAAAREPSVSPQVRGLVHSQVALLHARAGDGRRALEEFSRAITLLAGSDVDLGKAHNNRGQVYLQRRDVWRARQDYESACAYFSSAGDEIEHARALHNLGYANLLAGDLVQALRLIDSASQVLAPLSAVSRAVGTQDRAEALVAAGMTTEAAGLLADSAQAFGSHRLRQSQGEVELILARLLLLDEPRRAAIVARRASRRFTVRGSTVWALRADAVAIIGEIEAGSRRRDLPDRARQTASGLRAHRLAKDARALETHATRVMVHRGELAQARRQLAGIRGTTRDPIATQLLVREVRAELASAEGRRGNALQHVRHGLDDLHAWQSSFGSLDLQSSLVGHGRRLAFQGIGLAVEDGRPELVLEWSERARTLVSRVTPLRPPVNPEAAEDLARLRGLQTEDLAEGSAQARLAHRLRERIRQRAWYDEGSGEVSRLTTMAELEAELAVDDAALVAYVVAVGRITALVVTQHAARVVDLGPLAPVRALLDGMLADLDMAAAALETRLHLAVRAGLDDRLQSLAGHLVEPLATTIGDRRVVLTPSGALGATPWTMLPGFVGRPLTVPQSATRWTARHRVQLAPGSAGFVAGPDVARAEEEVAKAASSWARSTKLVGVEATAEGVARLTRTVDVLHVSAHGRHSADNPLFSGLELADGPWFGYDIDQLPRIPATIVLSACEVGRSSVRWAEESVGMTAAWLHAGARCVIASPASVDDDVACEVLTRTHQLIAGGRPPADALAEAAADATEPAASSFTCFGTGW